MACLRDTPSSSSEPEPGLSQAGSASDSEPSPTSSTHSPSYYYCAVCGKGFKRPSDLTKHTRYHEKQCLCEEFGCDASFATQKDLNRHLSSKHGKGCRYRCYMPACVKARKAWVYNRRDNFVRHMKKVHNLDDVDEVVQSWVVKR